MAQIIRNRMFARPFGMRRLYTAPVIVTEPLGVDLYGAGCKATYTDKQGRVWIYEGKTDMNGNCVWLSRRLAPSAFDGERQVWSELVGPPTYETWAATQDQTGKGWDFANNLLKVAQQYIGARQDAKQSQIIVPPQPTSSGMSTGAVIGIVAGVAVIGAVIYFVAKK